MHGARRLEPCLARGTDTAGEQFVAAAQMVADHLAHHPLHQLLACRHMPTRVLPISTATA